MFGHSDVPLFVSAQPAVLMGFVPVSFQDWLTGTLSYTACFFTHCISSPRAFRIKTGSRPSSFDIVLVLALSDRVQLLHKLSAFTPPTAHLQYLGSHVDGAGLCSTREVHHCGCGLRRQSCWRRHSQILESRFSRRLDSLHFSIGNMWTDCKEAYSSSVTPVSLRHPRAWTTSCLHSNRSHARKRELRSVATENVQEPGSYCDLLMVQDCTEQYALDQHPTTSFGALLADQPLNISR